MTDKNALIQPDRDQAAIPIHLVDKTTFDGFVKGLSAPQRSALAAQKFAGEGYSYAIVPDGDGWFAVAGVANTESLSSWCMAKLAEMLPAGTYRRAGGEPGPALYGWVTGQYRFDRYLSKGDDEGPRILLTKDVAAIQPALAEAAATALVRDLVSQIVRTRSRTWEVLKITHARPWRRCEHVDITCGPASSIRRPRPISPT